MRLEVLVAHTWNGRPVDVGETVAVNEDDRTAVECALTVVAMKWGRIVEDAPPAKKTKRAAPADVDENPPASRK